MTEDLRVVYESRRRGECADRALVLEAVSIPCEIVADADSCAVLVPADYSQQAADELRHYDHENPLPVPTKQPKIVYQNAVPGLLAYALIICAVALMAERSLFTRDWLAAGRVDGILIRGGEWWRTFTALTLHSGLRHLAGNLVFGGLFGLFAGRLMGSGVAWLAIVVAAACGNVLNTLLLDSMHRSIGASTAVFAALGLVAGFVWRGKLMSQERWPYRVGPIVGGFALLMYTGTGGPNTDVGAHLMGFLCGLPAGMLLSGAREAIARRTIQRGAGVAALLLLAGAWIVALAA